MMRMKVLSCRQGLLVMVVALSWLGVTSFYSDGQEDRHVPQCDRSKGSKPHRYDPLACWLWNLRVTIPDQQFRQHFISISIKDMVCTNYTVESIDSSYSKSTNNTNPVILVAVSGISAICQGQYHATGGLGGGLQALVQQSSEDVPSLGLSLEFTSFYYNQNVKMASKVTTDNCQANLQVASLHFDGSISAKIINWFRSAIAKYVSQALSTQICPAIQPELNNDLTNLIQTADAYLTKLLPSNNETRDERQPGYEDEKEETDRSSRLLEQVPKRESQRRQLSLKEHSSSTVDWQGDTPVLYKSLQWANQLLDRYLHRGLFVDVMERIGWNVHGDCGYFFRGFNGILRSLTGGEVAVDIPSRVRNLTFVVQKYAQVRLILNRIHLWGIDDFTNIDLLQPSNGTFFSAFATDNGVNVSLFMGVEVSSIEGGMFQGDTLNESFQIYLNTSSASVAASFAADLNRVLFQGIHMQDIIVAIQGYKNASHLSCLLAPIQLLIFEKLSVDANVKSVVFAPSGSTGTLEKDMDAMLNNLLELFLTEYDLLVTESLTGLVAGPARRAANSLIGQWIKKKSSQDAACTSVPGEDATPDFVDFNHLSILRQLNRFLDSSLNSINHYISCVAGAFNRDSRPHTFQAENIHIELSEISVESAGCVNHLGK
jgi:hypothetical protein